MNMRELKIGLMLFLLFCTGVFSGVLLDRKFAPRAPTASRSRNLGPFMTGNDAPILAEMTKQMELTPDQQKQVGEILRSWSGQVKQSRVEAIKHRQELFEKAMPLIRTNLTAEQIRILDDMVERSRRRQRQLLNRAN